MEYQEIYQKIQEEHRQVFEKMDQENMREFMDEIKKHPRIFFIGVGREGMATKAFAMRLMHMGVASYVVGETCTPNIKEGGVLVVCSGSGETKSLVNHAAKAKEMGARVALITINPNSSIANMADVVIEISAPSPKSAKQGDIKSIQPMGSLFEQSEGIFMDIAVMMLMERRGKDSDTMFGRHANME